MVTWTEKAPERVNQTPDIHIDGSHKNNQKIKRKQVPEKVHDGYESVSENMENIWAKLTNLLSFIKCQYDLV